MALLERVVLREVVREAAESLQREVLSRARVGAMGGRLLAARSRVLIIFMIQALFLLIELWLDALPQKTS